MFQKIVRQRSTQRATTVYPNDRYRLLEQSVTTYTDTRIPGSPYTHTPQFAFGLVTHTPEFRGVPLLQVCHQTCSWTRRLYSCVELFNSTRSMAMHGHLQQRRRRSRAPENLSIKRHHVWSYRAPSRTGAYRLHTCMHLRAKERGTTKWPPPDACPRQRLSRPASSRLLNPHTRINITLSTIVQDQNRVSGGRCVWLACGARMGSKSRSGACSTCGLIIDCVQNARYLINILLKHMLLFIFSALVGKG